MPKLAALACSAPSLAFNSVASSFSQRVRVDDMAATVWLAAARLSAWAGVLHDFGTASLFAPWVNSRAVGEA